MRLIGYIVVGAGIIFGAAYSAGWLTFDVNADVNPAVERQVQDFTSKQVTRGQEVLKDVQEKLE